MRFIHPSLLIWAGLIAVPIILYLVRPRPRSVRTTTLPFFKSLHRAYQESSWLRRLKQLLSLLLSILVIAASAFALARLVVSPPADALRTVVVLVDRSASMQAVADSSGTRLERGLTEVRNRLAGLRGSPSVIVMAYDRRPEILLSRSQDERAIRRALTQISVRPTAGDPSKALSLATDLAAMDKPAVIWHVTDHHSFNPNPNGMGATSPDTDTRPSADVHHPLAALPDGVKLEELLIGHAEPLNAGITALELRRDPQQHTDFEAFVQVHASLPEARDAELEVSLDGTLVDLRKLSLDGNHPQRLLLPLKADAQRDSFLTVRVKLAGDMLALDDLAYARVPRARPLNVLWVSPDRDPFTELALTSLGSGYDVLVGGPDRWPPPEPADIVIFDGWTPEKWPSDVPAVVINPPASFGPVRVVRLAGAGVVTDHVRATNIAHPVLYGVANDRVSVLQTAVFDVGGLFDPLWLSMAAEPLLVAGQTRGQSLVVFGFHPGRSESLPLMASYPLLLGNAINWAAQKTLNAETGRNHRTGDLVEVPSGDAFGWFDVSQPGAPREVSDPMAGRWQELDRIGVWRAGAEGWGAASLLSPNETRLAAVETNVAAASSSAQAWLSGDLTAPLLWLVLVVLVVESWLFHRKAVY
jgi:hypothetical protein